MKLAFVMGEENGDVGWTLPDDCDEERCSDPARTATQADATPCCEFFALDPQVRINAIRTNEPGWDALGEDPTWAMKLAFVLGEENGDEPNKCKCLGDNSSIPSKQRSMLIRTMGENVAHGI